MRKLSFIDNEGGKATISTDKKVFQCCNKAVVRSCSHTAAGKPTSAPIGRISSALNSCMNVSWSAGAELYCALLCWLSQVEHSSRLPQREEKGTYQGGGCVSVRVENFLGKSSKCGERGGGKKAHCETFSLTEPFVLSPFYSDLT